MSSASVIKRVVVAGPTTGKSTLISNSRIPIIDTDDLTRDLIPEWFSDKLFLTEDDDMRKVLSGLRDHVIGTEVGLQLARNPRLVCVTNIWGPNFFSAIRRAAQEDPDGADRPEVYYFRGNPERIQELMGARGGTMVPLPMLRKWVEDARNYAPDVFKRVVELKDDEFLALGRVRFSATDVTDTN